MPNTNLKVKRLPNYIKRKFIHHVPDLCCQSKNWRKKIGITFLKLFFYAIIKNRKNTQYFWYYWDFKIHENLINVFNFVLWKCSFKCFRWFFKVRWDQENQDVTLLMVPPNDRIALLKNLSPIGATRKVRG